MAHVDPDRPADLPTLPALPPVDRDEPHPVFAWLTTPRRGYLYRLLMAAGGVAVIYGKMTGEEVAVWLGVAAVIFNVTPAAHTPTGARNG